MNVLSEFDGMRCGAMALQRAGLPITNYFASEVDKHAIKVANAIYPEGVSIGCVKSVCVAMLPKIDLLLGGSPCQGFSFSGKQAGTKAIINGREILVDSLVMYLMLKEAGAEFLSQSALFWEFVKTWQEVKAINPNAKFLLENVRMKREYLDLISRTLGVEPIEINSNLLSAQSRPRLYWTNIEGVTAPEDRGVFLKDILELGGQAVGAMRITGNHLKRIQTSTDVAKGFTAINPDKAVCMTARQYSNWKGTFVTNGRTGCYRKLTPRECARLQTVPEHHIDAMLASGVSDTQLYKMLGGRVDSRRDCTYFKFLHINVLTHNCV